jgi:hypothetical protein
VPARGQECSSLRFSDRRRAGSKIPRRSSRTVDRHGQNPLDLSGQQNPLPISAETDEGHLFLHPPRARRRPKRCANRDPSLLTNYSLPARAVREVAIKLLRLGTFWPGLLHPLPAFWQSYPAFPEIAGRERVGPGLRPQRRGDEVRVEPASGPPGGFIAAAVDLAVVNAAARREAVVLPRLAFC